MKLQMIKFNGEKGGNIELNDAVFNITPNKECLADVIRWQLAKRQAGTHDVKERGEINRSKKKSLRQKGSGGARHGARTANIFVGGGVVFGPTPRSHDFKVNKKVRILALKTLLSLKLKENNLLVCEDLNYGIKKTKEMTAALKKLGMESVLFVDSSEKNEDFCNACLNLHKVDVLPVMGFNAYDGLSHEKIIFSKEAIDGIQKRLLGSDAQ